MAKTHNKISKTLTKINMKVENIKIWTKTNDTKTPLF